MSDDEFVNPDNYSFSHEELLKITSSVLNELLSNDTYVSDLPADVTLDEVNNQIALLHGKSITVHIVRGADYLPVIVPQSGCRVFALKKAIKRAINLKLERDEGNNRKISWKYIWRSYCLQCGENILNDDNSLLSDAGVKHKSKIYFVKKRRKDLRLKINLLLIVLALIIVTITNEPLDQFHNKDQNLNRN